jgi:hypothetical protein
MRMTETLYEVRQYSIAELRRIFNVYTRADEYIVNNKPHVVYLERYLRNIGAKTIVVEKHYIDRDYLEDFAEYYVRCFHQYSHRCTRLHFFSLDFDEQQFSRFLLDVDNVTNINSLRETYLGFIVLKPLPETVVGRTCLKTYPTDVKPRNFPITRAYAAHLYGISLSVNTLAFQEQDRVAAACATSALWSVFQGTGKLFQHSIPSPVEITKAATHHISPETRALPNRGLTLEQMAYAIRSVSLEPYVVRADNENVLKSTVYAYLCGQVPVLMTLNLISQDKGSESSLTVPLMESHAVVVAGYNLGADIDPIGPSGLLLRATRIDKLYVHDDQVGPFSRMTFDSQPFSVTVGGNTSDYKTLSTSWHKINDYGEDVELVVQSIPTALLIPLYHKIRIPFEGILAVVTVFDQLMELLRHQVTHSLVRLEWDVYLTDVNHLKHDVRNMTSIADDYRLIILTGNMPRFMWRATAFQDADRVLDLLFDATDIEQGMFFVRAIEYDPYLSAAIRTMVRAPGLLPVLRPGIYWRVVEWFMKNDAP